MSLTTFALPRDYVVFLSSGVSLTVKVSRRQKSSGQGKEGKVGT